MDVATAHAAWNQVKLLLETNQIAKTNSHAASWINTLNAFFTQTDTTPKAPNNDLTNTVATVPVTVVTDILDEIDNDVKNEEDKCNTKEPILQQSNESDGNYKDKWVKNLNLDDESSKSLLSIFNSFNSLKSNPLKQEIIWNDFCQQHNGFVSFPGKEHYSVDTLDSEKMNNNRYYSDGKWKVFLKDFVSIRLNLIENELKNMLVQASARHVYGNYNNNNNNNNKERSSRIVLSKEENIKINKHVNFLINQFKYYRTQVGVLPSKYSIFRDFTNYRRICEYYCDIDYSETFGVNSNYNYDHDDDDDDNKVDPMLKYYIIWHGMFILFHKINYQRFTIGFDDIYCGNAKKENKKEFSKRVIEHLLRYLCQTGIFGEFSSNYYLDDTESKENNNLRDKAVELLIKQLQLDENELSQLGQYCLQDVSETKVYSDAHVCDMGIGLFIVNRLAYSIFHDLFSDKVNSVNSSVNTTKLLLLFPKLNNLFKFIYNFCIYCHLYPDTLKMNNSYHSFDYADKIKAEYTTMESFYIKQYYQFKNKLYKTKDFNIDVNININGNETENENGNVCDFSLNKFNFFDSVHKDAKNHSKFADRDGTILHATSMLNMIYYTKILFNDGFDSEKKSRSYNKYYRNTPRDIAKKYGHYSILSTFSQNKNDNNNNNNNNTNDEENKTANEDAVNYLLFLYILARNKKK